MTQDPEKLSARIRAEIQDSFDEELELELEDSERALDDAIAHPEISSLEPVSYTHLFGK